MSLQNSATRRIVSVVGVLCGFSGIEHGIFEILQGNTVIDGLLTRAIGPAQRFWPGGTLHALTIIPNFLLTGILAILFSILVILWSAAFIQRKHGAAVFLFLSILQFLVGGGFGQIFLVLVTAAAATQIHTSLNWWGNILPPVIRRALAKLWGWFLVLFVVLFLSAMFAGIFGYLPGVSNLFDLHTENLPGFLYTLGYTALGFLLLTFLAGFSHDVEKRIYESV